MIQTDINVTKTWAKQSDIAEKAGVSIATVDRVINGRSGVSVSTSKRIWESIDEIQGGLTPQKNLSFDVILPDGSGSFLNHLADSVNNLTDAYMREGISIKCHRVKSFDPKSLSTLLDKVSNKTDGIAVMPMEDPFVRESIKNICNQDIPVVTMVSSFNSQRTVGHVGPNNRAAGRTSAHLISMMTNNKAGQVAVFKGSQSLIYSDHQERELGFINALRDYNPNLEVIHNLETLDRNEEAYKKVHQIMEEYPNLVAIYSVGSGTRGIGNALRDLKKEKKIIWIGHELTSYSREFLLDGTMNAVINQEAAKEAHDALQILTNHYRGDKSSFHPEEVKIDIYLRDNLP